MKAINAIRMGGVDVLPLVEGGKGVAVSNGCPPAHWAAAGGAGTFSAVNADSYDDDGHPIPQIYHGRTRRDRHEELVRSPSRAASPRPSRRTTSPAAAAASTPTCCGRWAAPNASSPACWKARAA